MGFILGEKSTQSQLFDQKGERIPTTFIKTSPCFIISIKSPDTHGYGSVQLGFKKVRQIKQSVKGLITKAGVKTRFVFYASFVWTKDKARYSI